MLHIILGLFLMALGIWGGYDMYYYVADVVRGGFPIVFIMFGLLATLAGFIPTEKREEC